MGELELIKVKITYKSSDEKEQFTVEIPSDDRKLFEDLKYTVVSSYPQRKYKDFMDYAKSEILNKFNDNRE